MIQPVFFIEEDIDQITIDFFWSNKNYVSTNTTYNINYTKESAFLGNKYPLLGFKFNFPNKDKTATYTLLIDRFRKRERKIKENKTKTRTSSYKHENIEDAEKNGRLSEIEITSDKMLIDFGQDMFYKKNGRFPNRTGFNKSRQLFVSKIKFAFRIRKTTSNSIKESKHLAFIEMVAAVDEFGNNISYKI